MTDMTKHPQGSAKLNEQLEEALWLIAGSSQRDADIELALGAIDTWSAGVLSQKRLAKFNETGAPRLLATPLGGSEAFTYLVASTYVKALDLLAEPDALGKLGAALQRSPALLERIGQWRRSGAITLVNDAMIRSAQRAGRDSTLFARLKSAAQEIQSGEPHLRKAIERWRRAASGSVALVADPKKRFIGVGPGGSPFFGDPGGMGNGGIQVFNVDCTENPWLCVLIIVIVLIVIIVPNPLG